MKCPAWTSEVLRVWVRIHISGPFHSSVTAPWIVSENSTWPEAGRPLWGLSNAAQWSPLSPRAQGSRPGCCQKNNAASVMKKPTA